MTLRGKRALVTGASRGIGAAIAKTLAYEGADVAITYEKSAESAAEVVSATEAKGRREVAIQASSADAATVQASVDILVNDAGILRLGELKDISLADIDALLNVNVRAPFIGCKATLAHLVKGGRIITIGSYVADRVPTPTLGVYAATSRRWPRSRRRWRGSSGQRRSPPTSCSRAPSTPT